MALRFLAAALALAAAPLANALYGARSDVISLTDKTFDQVVLRTEHVAVVEFFAPWSVRSACEIERGPSSASSA
jgi:hypothetical protein